jgi:hypothetical protein
VDEREEPEPGSWDRRRRAGWDEFLAARARVRALLARQAEQARRRSEDEAAEERPPDREDADD